MKILKPGFNLDDFFSSLRTAQKRALMLDYDGTLAPFRCDRDKAVPYPGVKELLQKITATGRTRLIIISGRPVENLVYLLGPSIHPEIWGSHGYERLTPDGKRMLSDLPQGVQEGISEAVKWIEKEGLRNFIEMKPAGIAFHWRGQNQEDIDCLQDKIRKKWVSVAGNFGLILSEFDGGLELRPADISKADAVEIIIKETGSNAVLAYLGDDVTDEDAFGALHGSGLSVLVRTMFRQTAADIWLTPPEELLAFLEQWIAYGG
ncbi:MAG: trehalose-phosphatase [Candidatus Zixiibacteriota bacterium]